MEAFNPELFFPRDLFDRITDTRVTRPEVIVEEARERARRAKLTRDGRLTILAADPLAVALAVDAIVHRGFSAAAAQALLSDVRGKGMDRFTRLMAA